MGPAGSLRPRPALGAGGRSPEGEERPRHPAGRRDEPQPLSSHAYPPNEPSNGHELSRLASYPEQRTEAKRRLLADVALAFQTPVLPDDPFPTRVTGRNARTAERLAAWADETREAAESLAERLREKPDDARIPDRTSTRLRCLAREWRVLEAFRQLHETHRCPGIFHRLRTKADFLAVCDRQADSTSAGYGERQRRVLSKRGISHRHIWAEARRLAAEIGLLDGDPCVEKPSVEVVPALDGPESLPRTAHASRRG